MRLSYRTNGAIQRHTTVIVDTTGLDLANAAVGLQQAKVMGEAQILMARKILQSQDQQGAAAIELMDAAIEGMNQAGDAMAAAATGLGGQIDVAA